MKKPIALLILLKQMNSKRSITNSDDHDLRHMVRCIRKRQSTPDCRLCY